MGKHLERFGPKRVDVSVSNAFNKAVKRRPPDERVKVKVVPTAHDTEQRAERARGREFTVTLVP